MKSKKVQLKLVYNPVLEIVRDNACIRANKDLKMMGVKGMRFVTLSKAERKRCEEEIRNLD